MSVEQVRAAEEVLDDAGITIGGTMSGDARHELARQVVEAVRRVTTGPWEIRYRRFRDPADACSVWMAGSRAEVLEEFLDITVSGPFAHVGDMSMQDTEKGYAEVWLWYGGRT